MMRHEVFEFVKKVINNNNNNNSVTTTTTTTIPMNISSATRKTTTIAWLRPQLENLNAIQSSVKEILNKTLVNVAKTNLSDYAAEYSLPPMASTEDISLNGSVAAASLPTTTHIEASTAFPAQTVATFFAGNKKRATIILYPTVSPESIVIPIVLWIFGFPILAFFVICCLRRHAKLARERERRRHYDMQDHAASMVRFSSIHGLNDRSRAVSLRPERSLSQGFTSLELDTVLEDRCIDNQQTRKDVLNVESPMETTSYKMSFSS